MTEGPVGAPNKSSSSRAKHPSSVRAIVYYVMPGILFMLLTAVLLLNFQVRARPFPTTQGFVTDR